MHSTLRISDLLTLSTYLTMVFVVSCAIHAVLNNNMHTIYSKLLTGLLHHITPLVINGLGLDTHTDGQMDRQTYTYVRTHQRKQK